MDIYGREKAWGERHPLRRWGYLLLGELHIPGRLRIWHIIRQLKRLGLWQRRSLSVLDAGGGEGAFAYYLARRFPGWKIVIVDDSEAALSRGREIQSRLGLRNLELRRADLTLLDETDQYDLIICSDVLEHIQADDLVVQSLARALKPSGMVVITSPSVPQPKHLSLVAWREKRIGFSLQDYGHVRQGYSAARLQELLEKAGLTVKRVSWTFGKFGTLMFDLFFVTGDSRPNPVVYAALFPLYIALSALDVCFPPSHGAAILGVGEKP
ncbi:MAG: class I SAM-dependent methyltransferase [Vicinamibacteria bacterium]